MERKDIILGLIVLWNITVFAMYGIDKRRAVKHKWRISEKSLILSAFFGGGAGAFLGMTVLRHKTKHMKFIILIPIALIVTLGLVSYLALCI